MRGLPPKPKAGLAPALVEIKPFERRAGDLAILRGRASYFQRFWREMRKWRGLPNQSAKLARTNSKGQ